MKNLTKTLGLVAIIGALSGSAKAGDYVQESRFGLLGAGHTITRTHTEPRVVYTPQRILYRDACGNCREGIEYTPRIVEAITSQCTTTHIHWDKSILSLPGRTLSCIGNALTPKTKVHYVSACQTPYIPLHYHLHPNPATTHAPGIPQQVQPAPAPTYPTPYQAPSILNNR